jgi:hypothetical protein
VAVRPLRPANHHRLGRPLPYQLANSTQAHPLAPAKRPAFPRRAYAVLTPISRRYSSLKGRFSRVTHPSAAVLTPEGAFSLDLHVLSTPPAFILSQDQTLHHKISTKDYRLKTVGVNLVFLVHFKEKTFRTILITTDPNFRCSGEPQFRVPFLSMLRAVRRSLRFRFVQC